MGLFELDSISIKTDSFAGFGYTDTFITELISLIETKQSGSNSFVGDPSGQPANQFSASFIFPVTSSSSSVLPKPSASSGQGKISSYIIVN